MNICFSKLFYPEFMIVNSPIVDRVRSIFCGKAKVVDMFIL